MAKKNLSTSVIAFVLLGLLLSACVPTPPVVAGTSAQPSAESTAKPSQTPAVSPGVTAEAATAKPSLTPNPLVVQVRTDRARAISATIPISGGVLVAQAADGTQFTLAVPANALLSDEAVRMAPVTAVDG